MPLTAANAQQMIQASQAKAREIGVGVCTAIVDADGRLFAFGRMEGVHWLSIDVAQAKAFTGALLRRDGADLQSMNPAVLSAIGAMYSGRVLAMGSVTPVRQDGVVIASVGCSGATDDQDGECARAARDAYVSG